MCSSDLGKLAFSTKRQGTSPWALSALGQGLAGMKDAFYQCSDFYVYREPMAGFKDGARPSVAFHPYLLMSENHFHRVWTLTSHRRLKNVVVLLEWLPDVDKVKEVPAVEVGIMYDSPDRRMKLQRAFDMLSRTKEDGTNVLDRSGFARLVMLIDPTVGSESSPAMSKVWDRVREGKEELTFADIDRMTVSQSLNMVHSERYYVALSLDEAEHLRAVMHMHRTENIPLLASIQKIGRAHV